MGGGFEIALACDMIIASENARMALPEPKVGLAALAAGVHRLPRQIGLKRAMGMMLTGRRVSAEEGARLGFVNEVVPHEKLLASAPRRADQILVMHRGGLCERGTHEQLLAQNGIYARLHRLQFAGTRPGG